MNKTCTLNKKILSWLIVVSLLTPVFPIPAMTAESLYSAEATHENIAALDAPVDVDGSLVIRELGITAGTSARSGLSPYGRDKLTFLSVGEISMNNGAQNRLFGHNIPVDANIFDNPKSVSGLPSEITASCQVAFDYKGTGKKDWVALYYYVRESATSHTFAVLAFDPVTNNKRELYRRNITNTALCNYFERVTNKDRLLVMTAGNFNGDKHDSLAILTYDIIQNNIMLDVSTLTGSDSGSGAWNFNNVRGVFPPEGNFNAAISLATGDLNHDGIDDLAFTYSYYGLSRVYPAYTTVFFGDPYDLWNVMFGYCFSKSATVPDSWDRKIFSAGNAIGDVDGDGRNELIIGGVTSSQAGFTTNGYWDIPGSQGWSDAIDVYKLKNGNPALDSSGRFSLTTGRPDHDNAANLAVARLDGLNTAGYLFQDNKLYSYNEKKWSLSRDLTSHSTVTGGTHRGSMAIAVDLNGDRNDGVMWKVPVTGGGNQILLYNADGTFRQALSPNSASSISFSTPNTDEDSPLLELIEQSVYYSDPIILAAAASPPHYEDLLIVNEGQYNESQTSFGKGTGAGSGYEKAKTSTTGTYISTSQDIEILGVPVASLEFETELTNSLTDSVSRYTEISETITYSNQVGQNAFVVYAYPTDVFRYRIHEPDQNGMAFTGDEEYVNVVIPNTPVSAVVDAELYTQVTKKYGLTNRASAKDVFSHTIGYPETYPTESTIIDGSNIYTPEDWASMSFGLSSVTQELEITEEMTEGTEWSNAITFKGGGGPAHTTIGGISGSEETYTRSTTNIRTMVYAAEMVNFPPAASQLQGYGFFWKMMQYTYSGAQTFPVITYQLRGVQTPPKLPTDVSWTTTDTSITLNWTQSQLSQASKDGTTGYKATLLVGAGRDMPVSFNPADGVYTASTAAAADLAENTAYSVELVATGGGGLKSVPQTFSLRTNRRGMGMVHFSEYADVPVDTDTEEAVLSVKVKAENVAEITNYKWQAREVGGDFVDVTYGTARRTSVPGEPYTTVHTLTVENPYSYMNEYRLLVVQEDNDIVYEISSDTIMIRSFEKYAVTTSYMADQITGAGLYYAGQHVTVTAPGTLSSDPANPQNEYSFYTWSNYSSALPATYSFIMQAGNFEARPQYTTDIPDAITNFWVEGTTNVDIGPGESYQFTAKTSGSAPLNIFWWRFSGRPTSPDTYIDDTGKLYIGEDEKLAVIDVFVDTVTPSLGFMQSHKRIYTGAPVPYEQEPTEKLKEFLMQFSAGKRNADYLGWDMMDPSTWDGIKWRLDAYYHELDTLEWDAAKNPELANLSGSLDLSGTTIRDITVRGTGITSIDLSNSFSMVRSLEHNKLEKVILKNATDGLYLNLQGNNLDGIAGLDLEGFEGSRSYNLQGMDLNAEEIDILPKKYPFTLYYGSGQTGRFMMKHQSGKKLDIDLKGSPELHFTNDGDSFGTDVWADISKADYLLIDSGLDEHIPYVRLKEDNNNYTIFFSDRGNTDLTPPSQDIHTDMTFGAKLRLPYHIFSGLVPVYVGEELVTSVPETDMFRFEVTWDNSAPPAAENEQRTAKIKAIPKSELGNSILEPGDAYDIAQLFTKPGSGEQIGIKSYDPDTMTFSITLSARLIYALGMSFEINGEEADSASFSMSKSAGSQPWYIEPVTVRNDGNFSVAVSCSLLGEDVGKFSTEDFSSNIAPGATNKPRIYHGSLEPGVYSLLLEVVFSGYVFNYDTYKLEIQTITGFLPVTITVTHGMLISAGTEQRPPSFFNFPDVYEGYDKIPMQSFLVRNLNDVPSASALCLTGPDSEHFRIAPYAWTGVWDARAAQRVTVYAKPGLPAGTYRAALTFVPENTGDIMPVFDLKLNVRIQSDVKTIDIKAIPGITPPAAGAMPVTKITETKQYTGTVSWEPNHHPFGYSTGYTASITLKPKTGFALEGIAGNFFTVQGANTVSNGPDSGIVTALFPETESTPNKTVLVGPQTGTLIAGKEGRVTFQVLTANIADGTYPVTVNNLPAGVSADSQITISAGYSVLTFTGNTDTKTDTIYDLAITVDGVVSDVFTLTIDEPAPIISISAQPAKTTTVKEGDMTGSLSVSAAGYDEDWIVYQWYYNMAPKNTGGILIENVWGSDFTIPTNLSAADSPYYFYCVVSVNGWINTEYSVVSDVAEVIVNPTGSITVTVITGIDVSGSNITQKTVTVSVDAPQPLLSPAPILVVVAYNDKKMVSFKITDVSNETYLNGKISMTMNLTGATRVKAFIWNDLMSIIPLSNSLEKQL